MTTTTSKESAQAGAPYIVDARGKKMVRGGRAGVARHARWMRRVGLRESVRRYVTSAALGYIADCEQNGWTEGQRRHNRLVEK
ncbi:hypothetical protein M4R23_02085 [Acidovorax sp. GBBC 3332]|nr:MULTISPECIES: hypothetical protein [unclassified Acidovorax]MDA8448509.1 hypothetical protein [Acidovorax sp. GBBC 3297]MDA8457524.1 hypothetical protein [Acidovorax sp. GBBC 3333]MDA8462952.1 hypothetical protein [Acidovorax sp. GBBC 3332]MDA8467594.1 hypothetical protein [Acidovorax sp. GBBC 3299]